MDHDSGCAVPKNFVLPPPKKSRPVEIFPSKLKLASSNSLKLSGSNGASSPAPVSITHFTKCSPCASIMPDSSKLVVFDTQLHVKKAFYALVYNGVRAAPLWDSAKQTFVGMLTVTDFIRILHHYYKSPYVKMEELEEHRIQTWREVLASSKKPFFFVHPTASIFEAVKILTEQKIHRLPILNPETGNVLCILTHKRILKYIYLSDTHVSAGPACMSRTLSELGIGTLKSVVTINQNTPLVTALKLFLEHTVSALPVVDQNGKCVDIYAKFDVIHLAIDRSYDNLDVPIKIALERRHGGPSLTGSRVLKCKLSETLGVVVERIAKAEVHRLVIVDDAEKVVGILSLSDILKFLILDADLSPDDPKFRSVSGMVRVPPTKKKDPSEFRSGSYEITIEDGAQGMDTASMSSNGDLGMSTASHNRDDLSRMMASAMEVSTTSTDQLLDSVVVENTMGR